MYKKITQFNTVELSDGIRVGVAYSVFKEDGTLYSNNNKKSYKADEEMVEKVNELYEYILNKLKD